MFYPFKFKPIFKEKIWGGNVLAREFHKPVSPDIKIGESWEVSAVPKDESIVANGDLAGKSLEDLIVEYKDLIVGERVFSLHRYEFPLLVKFLDAADKLSVQVHPDNAYAKKYHNSFGKTEIWFILAAKKGAHLIVGLGDGIQKKDLSAAIKEKRITDVLKYIPVKAGDVIYLPAGRVHAILEGIVLAEIQQTSDLTFRLYDWDRVDDDGKPRTLHIDESLAVINFDDHEAVKLEKNFTAEKGCKTAPVITGDFFSIEEIHLSGTRPLYRRSTVIKESFEIIIAVNGEGSVLYDKGEETFVKGESLLLPASMGEYTVTGNLEFLRVWR
ncbi:MAG: class I mannose-6-phosphate isomerase [Spirochaetes bacterium]|nr:class I mannose-6-phosphate isomerase [Spirochaetota bacterium]